jgi:hypothetical protein
MSLWHKIFGAPTEQTSKLSQSSVDEPAETESVEESRESMDEMHGVEIRSISGEEVSDAPYIDEESLEGAALAEETEATDRKRGRPRRRRRGGRGRKPGERQRDGRQSERRIHESAGADDLGGDFDDLGDDDDSLDGGNGATGDLDEGDDESLQGAHSQSAARRAIPSWDEAIGFIVDSNLQTRSQRPRPPRSDSRGGRPRGGRRR